MSRISEVIIVSGIPGAGKSSWIRKNTNPFLTEVFSADNYFIDKFGVYCFDSSKLSSAHSLCLRTYTERLIHLAEAPSGACSLTMVVDNTNTSSWEIAPYYSLAVAYGAPVKILLFQADPTKAHRRNIHGVEKDKVEKMAERVSNLKLPSFWNTQIINEWD